MQCWKKAQKRSWRNFNNKPPPGTSSQRGFFVLCAASMVGTLEFVGDGFPVPRTPREGCPYEV